MTMTKDEIVVVLLLQDLFTVNNQPFILFSQEFLVGPPVAARLERLK